MHPDAVRTHGWATTYGFGYGWSQVQIIPPGFNKYSPVEIRHGKLFVKEKKKIFFNQEYYDYAEELMIIFNAISSWTLSIV